MKFTKTVAAALAMAFLASACAHDAPAGRTLMEAATPEAAWAAWRAGDARDALALGERLSNDPANANEGRHVAVLTTHVRGEYVAATSHFQAIAPDYARRRKCAPIVQAV